MEKKSYNIFIVYFVILIFLSWGALFVGRALENPDNFNKILFYTLTGFVLMLWAFFDHFQLTGKTETFTVLHNPREQAIRRLISGFSWRWINNPLRLFLLSLVVLLPFYLFSLLSAQKTFFVGFVTYQVSPFASLFLAGEPAAFVETLIIMVPASLSLWFARRASNNFRLKSVYWIILSVSSFVVAQLMVAYHSFRYAGSDADLTNVFFFFFISVWLFYFTASIIVPLIIHVLSNSFGAAFNLFSSDVVLLTTVIVYFVLLLLFFVYLFSNRRKSFFDRLFTIR